MLVITATSTTKNTELGSGKDDQAITFSGSSNEEGKKLILPHLPVKRGRDSGSGSKEISWVKNEINPRSILKRPEQNFKFHPNNNRKHVHFNLMKDETYAISLNEISYFMWIFQKNCENNYKENGFLSNYELSVYLIIESVKVSIRLHSDNYSELSQNQLQKLFEESFVKLLENKEKNAQLVLFLAINYKENKGGLVKLLSKIENNKFEVKTFLTVEEKDVMTNKVIVVETKDSDFDSKSKYNEEKEQEDNTFFVSDKF